MHTNTFPKELATRLQEKKKLLKAADAKHKAIKTALIIDGGAMKGAWAAGVVAALQELGLDSVFDIVVAASSGTLVVPYLINGEGNTAMDIFCEYLADKRFINIVKFHPKKVIGSAGIAYANSIFVQEKPIQEEKIKRSRSRLFIAVTDALTGKGEYLDIQKENIKLIDAMHASSAVPFLYGQDVHIHGKQYIDGMIGCGIPVAPALEQQCTDIVIIENNPIGHPPFVNKLLIKTMFALVHLPLSSAAKKAIFDRKKQYMETLKEIEKAQKRGVHVGERPAQNIVDAFEFGIITLAMENASK